MNFLLRSNTHKVASEQLPVLGSQVDRNSVPKDLVTLEHLFANDQLPLAPTSDDSDEEDGTGDEKGNNTRVVGKNESFAMGNHLVVTEEEGCIIIPQRHLPDDWMHTHDIISLCSLDRLFVFPGEQVQVLACLSANKENTEIITPFKVVNLEKNPNEQTEDGNKAEEKSISSSESLIQMEDHRRQTSTLLQRFKDSHFFVRILESDVEDDNVSDADKIEKAAANNSSPGALMIDKGNFDPIVCGGAARNSSVDCYSLSNGEIVVSLQVVVAVEALRDPVIEILQFEKYRENIVCRENQEKTYDMGYDPFGHLLKWLLPLDNRLPSLDRSSSPHPSSSSGVAGASQRSASTGAYLFSHFRSYSMSSLPQQHTSALPPATKKTQIRKPSFDREDDWGGQYPSQKTWSSPNANNEALLSFRGISLERERFSIGCGTGMEGIHLPGRSWRRKIQIIQPVEIHCFSAECNADDLICVQIKNVSQHTPDIVIHIDAITIICETSTDGLPSSMPIACIEAGTGHFLPNISLRMDEEHSFILKPEPATWTGAKSQNERKSSDSSSSAAQNTDQYSLVVSCRCNYTESKLFFKKPISWRPRKSRDLMISVASEMSPPLEICRRTPELPVQVLTIQASNLTMEDLTMTILTPDSFTAPPSLGSLASPPTTPISPLVRFSEPIDGTTAPTAPNTEFGCTHLWLQSRVPLGCVPAQSMATVKVELVPLIDGIITLDTLQIEVKEKGVTYIPEHSLKINATSSISTVIV